MQTFISRFAEDESGVTGIEYSLIAGLISVVVIGALTPVGAALNAVYTGISTVLAAAL
jgi:pilus assembly protein Flp/PilA